MKLGLVSFGQDQSQSVNSKTIVSNLMDTVSNHDTTSKKQTNHSEIKNENVSVMKEKREVYSSLKNTVFGY